MATTVRLAEYWTSAVAGVPELEGAKFVSPLYVATTECDPSASVAELKLAMPLDTVPIPRVELPSENVTVPVGVPVPFMPLTMAVNVKLEPCAPLAGLTVTEVEVEVSMCVLLPLLPLQPSGTMEMTAVAQRSRHP